MKPDKWWRDEYDERLESIFDRMDTPIRYAVTFIAGIMVGIVWMLFQKP